jgi:serine/threonine-protein kinase RsbW
MGRRFSESSTSSKSLNNKVARKKPRVFIISRDRKFLDEVLSACAEVPSDYTVYTEINGLAAALGSMQRVDLAFVFIVEKKGADIDAAALRGLKLDYPQIHFVALLEECEQRTLLRLQSLGVQDILLAPFSNISLTREIATALPNVPQFKRHPDFCRRGQVRMDFLLPSDLSYVLGMNYFLSLLLKEFDFPVVDARINIPLACDEAITNAILHGNKNDPSKKVTVQVYVSHSRFKMRVRDEGEGFDLSKLKDPTEEENLLRSSGRGIYLIKNIMDSVEFKDGGRTVEMEKKNTHSVRT